MCLSIQDASEKSIQVYYGIIRTFSILAFVLIMILIVLESGESLITQYTTQIIYYSKPELLVKRFSVPFTPLGFLP